MKRKWLAIVLIVTMALAMLPGFAAAQVGGIYYPLYAGQDWQVGKVEVWNDADNLYVKYMLDEVDVTDEGWYLTEVHLHIGDDALDPEQFPLNGKNKNNPAPGLFDYSDTFEYTEMTDEKLFTIPLTDLAGFGSPLEIAAHAVVTDCNEDVFTPELSWMRSTERTTAESNPVAYFPGYGTQWTKEQAFAIELDPEQLVWDNGLYYPVAGVTTPSYASWKYAFNWGGSYAGQSDLRRFNATFDLPEGYEVLSGTIKSAGGFAGIPINDNVFLFLNEELLFWGGTRVSDPTVPDTFMGVPGVQALRGAVEPKETDLWYIPGTFPTVEGFVAGENYLDVFAEENERWGGMGELVLELEYRTYEHQSAWAATAVGELPFNTGKGNWATYFCYTLQLEQYTWIEQLFVPATSNVGVDSTEVLANGQVYQLRASGTFTYNTAGDWADAEWYLKNGVIVKGDTEGSVPYVLDVSVANGVTNVNWGDYNADHEYEMNVTGTGSVLHLFIHDSAYGDNSGGIWVDVYSVNY